MSRHPHRYPSRCRRCKETIEHTRTSSILELFLELQELLLHHSRCNRVRHSQTGCVRKRGSSGHLSCRCTGCCLGCRQGHRHLQPGSMGWQSCRLRRSQRFHSYRHLGRKSQKYRRYHRPNPQRGCKVQLRCRDSLQGVGRAFRRRHSLPTPQARTWPQWRTLGRSCLPKSYR